MLRYRSLSFTSLLAVAALAWPGAAGAGAPVQTRIEFGPRTSYGSSTAVQSLTPSETQTQFSAAVTGLPAGTLHYRAVAISDFGTFAGPDATVEIPAATPPPAGFSLASHIASPHGRVKANKLEVIKGAATATLGVARVRIALLEPEHGAHVARSRGHRKPRPACLQLGHDAKLHLVKAGKHSTCEPTTFLNATGTTNWTLKLRHHLPKGSYIAISEAIDTAGHTEPINSGDQARFQIT
jgi:hypothetical protein